MVINHSLLFSDLVTDNAILGEYSHLVLDEAHNLEKVAAHYLGTELSVWRVKNLTDQLCGPGFVGCGDSACPETLDRRRESGTGHGQSVRRRHQVRDDFGSGALAQGADLL